MIYFDSHETLCQQSSVITLYVISYNHLFAKANMVLKFTLPCVTQIIGPSLSGKSTIMFEILTKRDVTFDQKTGMIYYCYGTYSTNYLHVKESLGDNITFIAGLPTEDQVRKWSSASPKQGAILLVLDDLMGEISVSSACQAMVTRLTHHCNLGLFILSQNLFQKGPVYRCLSLNTHYFIFCQTKRDHAQLLYFGRQLFPLRPSLLYSAYLKATEGVKYGHLRVDLHPASNPMLALTSDFLSKYPVVYLGSDANDDIKHLVI